MMDWPLDPPRWDNFISARLVDEALAVAAVPGAVLAARRPPLPQIREFPPRFGYVPYAKRQATISDVIDVNRIYNDVWRVNWTGTPGGYAATSRPAMNQGEV